MNVNVNDVAVGAAAGVIATVPMSLAMEKLHDVLHEHDGPLPPREVTESLLQTLGSRRMSDRQLERLTLTLHFAYGGAGGALFAAFAPHRVSRAVGIGILYGLSVWTGSYLGLLPALGLRRHARHDSNPRTGMMIAAHIIWGASLGLLVRARLGRRVAARDPDRH